MCFRVFQPQVLTIEPGCYFIDFLIDRALADPELNRFILLKCQYILYSFLLLRFIVEERINAYRGTGGVRIEDDIIINANGAELMSIVPRCFQYNFYNPTSSQLCVRYLKR